MVRRKPECIRLVLISQLSRELLTFSDQVLSLIWDIQLLGRAWHRPSQASWRGSLQEAFKNAAVLQNTLVFSIIYATYHQGHRHNTSSTNFINQLLTFPVHGFLHRYWWLFSNFTQTSALLIQRCKLLIIQKQSNGCINIKQSFIPGKTGKKFCPKNGQNVQCLFQLEFPKSSEYFTT